MMELLIIQLLINYDAINICSFKACNKVIKLTDKHHIYKQILTD
jgi:hypothetical protein